MKKYVSTNAELMDRLEEDGINFICTADMDIVVTDEDADKIDELVQLKYEYANMDYLLEDYEKEV